MFVCWGGLALALAAAPSALAQPGMGPTPVVAGPVTEREMPPSTRLVGTVLAQRRAIVAAEYAGRVAEVLLREGDACGDGAVIARLDDGPARMLAEEAEARLGSLRCRLEELENGTRPEVLVRQRALVDEAEAMRDKWSYEKKRVEELFTRGVGNPKEMHDVQMEHTAAERRLAQASADLDMWKTGARKEEIARARFDVAAQTAVVARLKRDLSKAEIRAPFKGFIVARRAEVGEWVVIGGAICEVVEIDSVRVRVDAPEAATPFARPGQPASIDVEAIGKSMPATIARIIPMAAQSARTFPVEVDVDNANHALLPGMFVWASVPVGPVSKRLMVSKDAIVARGMIKTLFVIRPGENGALMAIPTTVMTGMEIGAEIEVQAAGLAAGDEVVCRANERLFGPTPVVVQGRPAAASQPAASQPAVSRADGSPR